MNSMTDGSPKRLFIAIDLPEALRILLADLQLPVRGVSWTPSESLHLTLRFLGETEGGMEETIVRHLARISVEPFILTLRGLGVFPPRGPPKVVWAGVGHGHPRLFQLRQQIDDALLASGLEIDIRTFVAHITLGRCGRVPSPGIAAFLKRNRDFEGPPFRVDRFNLYSSRLTREGAIHTVEQEFRLHG